MTSRSVQPFLMGPKCYAVQYCHWGKPPRLSLPLRFCHPAGERPSHGNMHKNLVKIAHVVPRYSRGHTDKQTHTDVLITILRNCSRGRSNYGSVNQYRVLLWNRHSPKPTVIIDDIKTIQIKARYAPIPAVEHHSSVDSAKCQ